MDHPAPRQVMAFDQVHLAEVSGHVAVWFTQGRTDTVELLVGTSDPPTMSAGILVPGADLGSFASTVVRPGEYWMARAKRGRTQDFRLMFTPLA